MQLDQLRVMKQQLDLAVGNARSTAWCLRLWGRFIRARDGHRCVICEEVANVQAHHIFRRTVWPEARFDLGNGITLCRKCHGKLHETFNGRPEPGEPLNARGGDDQDYIADLYSFLIDDADARGLSHDEFYYISDAMLDKFVAWQGWAEIRESVVSGRRSRIEAANEIWRLAPEPWYSMIASDTGRQILGAWNRDKH